MYPQKPSTQYVVNGWYLELPGLINPCFEEMQGITKTSGDVTIVDAGSNKKLSFSDQIIDFGKMTLNRTMQGTPDDAALAAIVMACIQQGLKFICNFVKLHNQAEVFRIIFQGFRFSAMSFPAFNINSGDKVLMSYPCTCDDWDLV